MSTYANTEMQHKLAQRIFEAKIALAGDNLTAWSKCVHGEATAEQIAALMAILSRLYSDAPPRTYEQRVHDMACAMVGAVIIAANTYPDNPDECGACKRKRGARGAIENLFDSYDSEDA